MGTRREDESEIGWTYMDKRAVDEATQNQLEMLQKPVTESLRRIKEAPNPSSHLEIDPTLGE